MFILPTPKSEAYSNKTVTLKKVDFVCDSTLSDEEYFLKIDDDGIATVKYSAESGRFYAEQTLRQLKAQGEKLPVCVIRDKPSFEYRAFMLDCARHMFELDEIKKLIDTAAFLKLNKFHWHLTDDQGWRIESERLPLLNTVSSVRRFSDFGKKLVDKPYGRVYTKAELKEIVDYCRERSIEVIPEFDVPGHTSSLLAAYPELSCGKDSVEVKTHQGIFSDVLCPANEKAYEAVFAIFDEICEIFPSKYIHLGGDETPSRQWEGCPECQKLMAELGITNYRDYQIYFMNKVIDYLKGKGKTCIIWNDGARGKGLSKNAVIQYWKESETELVTDFANLGGKVIVSPFSYYYTDYDYYITPLNRTYSFNPILKGINDESSVLGLEVPIWTEYISDNERLETMLYPRAMAVAEAAWNNGNKYYNKFLKQLDENQKIFDELGIKLGDRNEWTKNRLKMVEGWLKFVFNNYTVKYIKNAGKQ